MIAIVNLSIVLRKWRLMSEITLRDAASEIGISAATLLRIEQGGVVDGRTMSRLVIWLIGEKKNA